MTLDRSYIGYLGFLGIDLFKSVLMYSNGAICLIKLLFKMGLFTVRGRELVMGKHPDLMVGPPTATVFPTNDRKFEISQFFRKKFEKI
jgi:hypothetical protein